MHRYLRAIGFSKVTRDEMKELVLDSVRKADSRGCTLNSEDVMLAEFCRDYADGLGICAAGTFDDDEVFHADYYYPYLKGTGITSYEDLTVERHAAGDSYAGICDDMRMGISLIFYLQNKIPYVRAQTTGLLPVRGTSLTLSALSVQGAILLPLQKLPEDEDRASRHRAYRTKLMTQARDGDEDAIELLTLEDMDLYSEISQRIQYEDVYSLVDTSVMPYGVECDQYTVIGEIVGMRHATNHITEEQIEVLTLRCNELTFDVAINIMDLLGEPQIGRRFKGVIWLQGKINFPDL
ncbi:MAG: DUF3881 family protein [Lachnospiraceae bacterium]|nr:DUF3881 family protein [Lachnospiraceae bacterium]MCR5477267.1 DUF3881 family protein [Lachnospiraceae bacterium]